MLCGLQGQENNHLRKIRSSAPETGAQTDVRGGRPSARPAAIDQLEVLGNSLRDSGLYRPRFGRPGRGLSGRVAKALAERYDVLILDTAGRLHIDEELMEQLKRIERN